MQNLMLLPNTISPCRVVVVVSAFSIITTIMIIIDIQRRSVNVYRHTKIRYTAIKLNYIKYSRHSEQEKASRYLLCHFIFFSSFFVLLATTFFHVMSSHFESFHWYVYMTKMKKLSKKHYNLTMYLMQQRKTLQRKKLYYEYKM